MSEAVLLTILCGMAGCMGGIFVWIYQHTKTCHGHTPEQLAQGERAAAVEAADKAATAAELTRLSREIGHQTQPGSILERMHRYGGHIRGIREHLGMDDDSP